VARDSVTRGVLVIVSPGHLYLVKLVRQHFKRTGHVEVIVDRRRRERRILGALVPDDRRREDRRQHDIRAELGALGWTMIRRPTAVPSDPTRPWHLPWLQVELVLRTLLRTRWNVEVWPLAKTTLCDALGTRNRIRREGWFN
jgi:hypothetical protein